MRWFIVIVATLVGGMFLLGFIDGIKEACAKIGNTRAQNARFYIGNHNGENITFNKEQIEMLTGMRFYDELIFLVTKEEDIVDGVCFKYNKNGKAAIVTYEKVDRLTSKPIGYNQKQINAILGYNFPNHEKTDFICEGETKLMDANFLSFKCEKHNHGFNISVDRSAITCYSNELKNENVEPQSTPEPKGKDIHYESKTETNFINKHGLKEVS